MDTILIKMENLDLSNTENILNFGNETLSKIKDVANEVSKNLERKDDNLSILKSLDKIFNNIDYDELKFINDQANGFNKILNYITKRKDKIVGKYVNISNELDSIYLNIKKWESKLQGNNKTLKSLKSETQDIQKNLREYLQHGKEILFNMSEENLLEKEKKSLMNQKMQDIEYSVLVCEQVLNNINVLLKTNYNIYKKLVSVYTTTMPIIQNQINMFRIAKEQNELISTLQILDQKKNDLIKIGSGKVIDLGKQSNLLLSNGIEDFQIINDTINNLKSGIDEMVKLENEKMLQIETFVSDYKRMEDIK